MQASDPQPHGGRAVDHAQTLAAGEDLDAFKTRIEARLMAVSRVHSLLSRSEQEPIAIGALVRLELEALGGDLLLDRVKVSGPDVRIRNSTAQMLALALHELASNACKYRAPSAHQGQLRIGRPAEGSSIGCRPLLRWIEERPVCVPVGRDRRGFGRELIKRALRYSFNADTCCDLDEAGLRCTIALPLGGAGPRNEAHEILPARQ